MPEPMTEEQLAAIRTHPMCRPGWAATTVADCYGQPHVGTDPEPWCVYDTEEDDPPIVEAALQEDAAYVAAAMNAVPALIADVERSRQEAKRFRDAFDRLRSELAEYADRLDDPTTRGIAEYLRWLASHEIRDEKRTQT